MKDSIVRSFTVALLTLFLSLASGAEVSAQAGGTITGQVLGDGSPLGSVQVTLPELGLGGLTRQNGRYLLTNVPVGVHQIRAERLGYSVVTQQVTVSSGGTTESDFQLATEALGLDEIVVTGTAGEVRRRELGNSLDVIDLTETTSLVAARSLDELLSGQVPGMVVTQGSGQVGDGAGIRLRGSNSRALSNQPLYYIDGVRVRSDPYPFNTPIIEPRYFGTYASATPLNDINPADIDRIEVIKGPAATTLYGAEAASGVIQIFTKGGTAGRPVVEATIETGVAMKTRFGPNKSIRGTPLDEFVQSESVAGGSIKYQNLDPWMRDGLQQRYSVSVRGSSDPVTYFVSGMFEDDEGLFVVESDKNYSLRANVGIQLTDYLDLSFNTMFNHKELSNINCGDNVEGICGETMYEGIRNLPKEGRLDGIVFDRDDLTDIDRLVTGGTVRFAPVAESTTRLTVGYDRADIFGVTALDFAHPLRATGKRGTSERLEELFTVDFVSTYSYEMSSDFSTDISGGFQSITKNSHFIGAFSQFFAGPGLATLSTGSNTVAQETRQRVITGGYFGQAVFKYMDRYFVTAGVRRDGNSSFGGDFGWATYPKVSGSWVLSDEDFWSESMGSVRLRAAWGRAGRAPGAFDATRTWDPVPWAGTGAFDVGTPGNPALGPETTTEIELGFEASLLDDRLALDFTWFKQNTTEALVPVSEPQSQRGGWGGQLQNIGELQNKGIELMASVNPVRGSVNWEIGANLSTLHSLALDIGGPNVVLSAGGGGGSLVEGQPVPVVRGNFVTNPDEIGAPNVVSGHLYGPNAPTFVLAPFTSLTFAGGVSVTARAEYRSGGWIRNGGGRWAMLIGSTDYGPCIEAQRVIETGDVSSLTALERVICNQDDLDGQAGFIYPTDFFKLREVSIRIPLDFIIPESYSASLTLAGGNLWRWTKDEFREFDPEQQRSNELTTQIWAQPSPPRMFTSSIRIRL